MIKVSSRKLDGCAGLHCIISKMTFDKYDFLAYFEQLEDPGEGLKSRYDNTFRISPDLTLKLSYSKTVATAFHFNNETTKHEFAVCNNNLLPFCAIPTFFGVKLNGFLTFCYHIETLRKLMKSCHTCRAKVGCWRKTLQITTLSLVYFKSEYCAPVW